MLEAFKIGITIALTNTVSASLGGMANDFLKTDATAIKLRSTLKSIGYLNLAAAGIAVAAGAKMIEASIKPAMEYAHQLNIMNMAGLKQEEIAAAVGDAWSNTSKVMTTTATQNLKTLLDLRNVLGNMDEARALLPTVSKIQAVMQSSTEGAIRDNADSIAFGMAKALDIIGAVKTPEMLAQQAEMMSKVITAFQGRVQPQMFQSVFSYARQGKFDLSDEFKYEILPSLMLEMAQGHGGSGGGSRGVGPMIAAFYRLTNQGYINKKSLPELQALGLVDASTALQTTTSGTTVGAMKDAALAASNPFRWVNEVLVPAIRRKYGEGVTDEFVRTKINEVMRGNQLAASMATEFFTKQTNFLRDQRLVQKAMSFDKAFSTAEKNDPDMAINEYNAQLENVKTAFGKVFIPVMIPLLRWTAEFLNLFTKTPEPLFKPTPYPWQKEFWHWGSSDGDKAKSPGIGAPPSDGKIIIDNNIHLDGRQIGSSTTEYLYNGLNVLPSSGAMFDGGMSQTPIVIGP